MSLTTYQDLKDAVVAWPDLQGEADLESYADTLIALGESRINISLRLRRGIKSISVPTAVSYYQLPTDFLEIDRVVDGNGLPLQFLSQDQVSALANGETQLSDSCAAYTTDGSNLNFIAPTAFTLTYYAALPSLEIFDSNWLYVLAPGLYLYSALIDASIFSKESEQETARYAAEFQRIAARLMELDRDSIMPRAQTLRSVRRL